MRILSKVVVFALVLGLAAVAQAAKGDKAPKAGKAPAVKPLKGDIVSITPDATKPDTHSIVVSSGRRKAAQQVTVIADANTQITLDGQAAKIGDLKAGQKVTVAPASGTATKVEALSAAAPKAGGGKRGKK